MIAGDPNTRVAPRWTRASVRVRFVQTVLARPRSSSGSQPGSGVILPPEPPDLGPFMRFGFPTIGPIYARDGRQALCDRG